MITTRSLRRQRTLKGTVDNKLLYKLHKKKYGVDMTFEEYDRFIRLMHEYAVGMMIEGYTFKLKPKLGIMLLNKTKCEFKMRGDKIIGSTFPHNTRKMNELKKEGIFKRVYNISYEYVLRMSWRYTTFRNAGLYYFRFNKVNKTRILDYAERWIRKY